MLSKKRIIRHSFLSAVSMCALFAALIVQPSLCQASPLISNVQASQLGLVRSWFVQVHVDSSEHKVVHWVIDHDQIFALTSAGVVQSIDAETGKTLWRSQIGSGHSSAAGVAVNKKYVVVLGAGRMYALDRADGHQLWSRQVGGATSAAPALSRRYAYVALLNGLVEGHNLENPAQSVWQFQSFGRIFQSPTTTGKVVSWPTDRGLLYVGKAESPQVLFRVETNGEIVAAPAERDPYLYVASLDGYLYSYDELSGDEQWRYATGFAITSKPAVVGDKVYVASEGPSLHAVDAVTGLGLWQAEGAAQFAAFGKEHTYCLDRFGQLMILDSETGSLAGRLASNIANTCLVNEQTDRIYLVNDQGLVQCLHEIEAKEPMRHRGEEQEAEETAASEPAGSGTKAQPDEGSGSKEEPPQGDSPFESDSPFEEDEADEADDFDVPNPFQ